MDDYIIENDKYFSRSARYYDLNTRVITYLRNKLYRVSGAGPADKILDVATGTGAVALTFAKNGHRLVTGIDLSADMLKIAKSKNGKFPVAFIQGDAAELPFEKETFDIAVVSFALHDMPFEIRVQALKEINRVMKRKATLVIMDYAKPDNILWQAITFGIINAYEGIYFNDFMRRDLSLTIKKASLEIIHHERLLTGAVQLLKRRMAG